MGLEGKKIILISSNARSGSTQLQKAIDSHPECGSMYKHLMKHHKMQEMQFLIPELTDQVDYKKLYGESWGKTAFFYHAKRVINEDIVKEKVLDKFRRYTEHEKYDFLMDKSVTTQYRMDFFNRIFGVENVRHIYIKRHPAIQAAAMMKWAKDGTTYEDILKFCIDSQEWVDRQRIKNVPNCSIVKYHNLCKFPQRTLKRLYIVTGFNNINFKTNIKFDNTNNKYKNMVNRNIETIRKYKKELSKLNFSVKAI